MAEDGTLRETRKHFLYADLRFGPLENQSSTWLEYPPAFGKTIGQILAPCALCELSVLLSLPGLGAAPFEVGRIKDHEMKALVRMRKRPIISYRIRGDSKYSAVTEHMLFPANITAQNTLILLIKVEHAATAAGIENLR